MLKNVSTDIKTLVLLKLTKKLIESTNEAGMLKLERLVNSKNFKESEISRLKTKNIKKINNERKKELKFKINKKLNYSPSIKIKENDTLILSPIERKKSLTISAKEINRRANIQKKQLMEQKIARRATLSQIPLRRIARTPVNLPATVNTIKPQISETPIDIDLGKLNPLLKDRNVKTIETEGDGQRVVVTGKMGRQPTGIILTKKEIDEVINKFSKESKIPTTEGLFKVVVGNVVLTAMISETIGSRFIIKKM